MSEFDYPIFTKAMKETHTILVPSMVNIHFRLCVEILNGYGYKCELLTNESSKVVDEGLKYVHNDTCYPATLVIGQFIDALNNRNDLDKIALLITQTGGGCRASNYIHLLRKALKKAGYGQIPVISVGVGLKLENSGFEVTLPLIRRIISGILYGDMLMYLYNKTRSYEIEANSSWTKVENWIKTLGNQLSQNKGLTKGQIRKNLKKIVEDFNQLPIKTQPKVKVGIVGEIYVKYASLGNNGLEEYLVSENCEVMVPGVLSFLFYCLYNLLYDIDIYGGRRINGLIYKFLIKYMEGREKLVIKAFKDSKFEPFDAFKHTKELSNGIISHGAKMGEGWLLTAEMIELIQKGYGNIVCTQPFGCLPNHICGKGVMKKIKSIYPESNIVAIDYDPSATKVNQENRIKLMLLIAKENLENNK